MVGYSYGGLLRMASESAFGISRFLRASPDSLRGWVFSAEFSRSGGNEAPKANLQAPGKRQASKSKPRASRVFRKIRLRPEPVKGTPITAALELGNWSFPGAWGLELGASALSVALQTVRKRAGSRSFPLLSLQKQVGTAEEIAQVGISRWTRPRKWRIASVRRRS